MDKIEAGDFIRTTKGKFGKTIEIYHWDYRNQIRYWVDWGKGKVTSISQIKKVKHSKNKIDLIEKGDYVNGMEVYKGKTANGGEKLLAGNHIINGMALELVNIKSIVTHEQFESLKYNFEGGIK